MTSSTRSHRRGRVRQSLNRAAALAAVACLCLGPLAGPSAAAPSDRDAPSGRDAPESVALDRGAVRPAADPTSDAQDQFIVAYKKSAAASTKPGRATAWGRAAREADVSVQELKATATGSHVVKTDEPLTAEEAQAFMQDLRESGTVDYVEPDTMQTIALTPVDARYAEQWGFNGANGMRVPAAWDAGTGTGSVVAVLDTGIAAHPDLDGNVVAGYDFVSDAAAARDGDGRDADAGDDGDWFAAGECGQAARASNSSWHGTHVAGTIGAVANTAGVIGVAPDARIQPVRVLAKCGGRLSDISDAIVWASGGSVPGVPANATPADVINLSMGGPGTCTATYQSAIDSAVARGTTVVVAAGNESQDASRSTPAGCENVVTVASSTKNGALSYFSNVGARIDVTAPGGDTRTAGGGILSTVDAGTTTPRGGGYAAYQGTSMAAPHVAGLVALMTSAKSSLAPAEVESALKAGARALPAGCAAGCGTGLVDAGRVMAGLIGTTPTPPPTDPVAGQLLKNPGFESGTAGWNISHADAIEQSGSARTGSWHASLNGVGRASTYTVDQRVSIPAGAAATLRYHLQVGTSETSPATAYDRLRVQVVDGTTARTVKSHSNLDASSSYAAHSVDISAFAGKTVTLRFRGVEDGSLPTTFRIDDTSAAAQ